MGVDFFDVVCCKCGKTVNTNDCVGLPYGWSECDEGHCFCDEHMGYLHSNEDGDEGVEDGKSVTTCVICDGEMLDTPGLVDLLNDILGIKKYEDIKDEITPHFITAWRSNKINFQDMTVKELAALVRKGLPEDSDIKKEEKEEKVLEIVKIDDEGLPQKIQKLSDDSSN